MSSAFEGLPKTPNLKLNKPGYDNVADIEALNENADILDEEIQGIKNTFVKSVNGINAGDGGNVDLGIMPISQGGTGASTAEQARTNLGIKDIATYDVLPISQGGTGATTASQACANIGALPTSGGTVTGVITSNNLTFANKKNDREYFEVIGATDATNGAFLQLYGKDNTIHPNSEFRLGNISCDLKGDSTGNLKWGGKNLYVDGELIYNGDTNNNQRGLELPARTAENHGASIILNAYTGLCSVQIDNFNNAIRFIGRTPADHWASGNLGDIWTFVLNKFGNGQNIVGEGYIAKGNNYVKYASGLIIQWGGGYYLNSGSAINFSIPFSDTNYAFVATSHDSNGYIHSMNILTMSNTGVTTNSSNYPAGCRWIAIGY